MIGTRERVNESTLKAKPETYEDALLYLYAYQNGTDKRPPHSFDFTDGLAEIFEDAIRSCIHEDAMVDRMADVKAINSPLEPMKVYFALRSELLKYDLRMKKNPEEVSPLDITIMHVLMDWLKQHGYMEADD